MKIHEYQAKKILSEYGVKIPRSDVADSPERAAEIFRELGTQRCAVKAQILAGGRGKGGGVKIASTPEEADEHARSMLRKPLVTPQTGPKGEIVNRVLVEEGCDIADELYLGVTIDRSAETPVMIASDSGGMDIEEVAAESPDKILKDRIDPLFGLQAFQARNLAKKLCADRSLMSKLAATMIGLSALFLERDCSLAEINPLVITRDGGVIALDAKLNFDDNALYRQQTVADLRETAEDAREAEAAKHDLSYVGLAGNIGCMVNGAGLAMATMDIIKLHGGEPANFLDVGGGADAEKVTQAFKLILTDENVKAVLVNIFGGIMRCDVIAHGIIEAVKEIRLEVPLVVRLEGTNVDKGKELLAESGLDIIAADGMDDAARKVVETAK